MLAPLICLDPGHGTPPAIGRQVEPIGPGSRMLKIKDGGGAPGEAAVVLAIARRTRTRAAAPRLPCRDDPHGADLPPRHGRQHRPGAVLQPPARRADAAHPRRRLRRTRGLHGVATLYPAYHRGWTDDIYARSLRAARLVQRSVVAATGAADRGLVPRSDLTGFNWANVPAILVETGFVTNAGERRLLHTGRYQARVARGLASGVVAALR